MRIGKFSAGMYQEIHPPPAPPKGSLPVAMRGRQWVKGQSGNPSGRSKIYTEAMKICREASPEAARKMVELMDSDDHRVAYMAANAVLERAWGKPKEYDPSKVDKPPIDLGKMNDEQRAQFRALLEVAISLQERGESGDRDQ